jgi:hypothetical protein
LKHHDLLANRCNLIADTRFILTADTRFILTADTRFFYSAAIKASAVLSTHAQSYSKSGPRGTVDHRM